MDTPTIILASASPRRRDLLAQAGIACAVRAADIDESLAAARPGATPEELAAGLALRKALAVAALEPGRALIVAADTIVVAPGGALLAKAADEAEARRMLALLSGRRHRVVTGVALADSATGRRLATSETSEVRFRALAGGDLESYIASGLWRGKAGAYGAQDDPTPVAEVIGSRSNVIGLPMEVLTEMIAAAKAW